VSIKLLTGYSDLLRFIKNTTNPTINAIKQQAPTAKQNIKFKEKKNE
jgi:hypothetical protein